MIKYCKLSNPQKVFFCQIQKKGVVSNQIQAFDCTNEVYQAIREGVLVEVSEFVYVADLCHQATLKCWHKCLKDANGDKELAGTYLRLYGCEALEPLVEQLNQLS